MAKNGQKVDDLYLSIGLDVDQLQLDFDTAGKTVSQTMSRLNSEIKQLKIKTSIDMSKLDGAGTAVDKVRVKEQALTRELQLQTQKMNILTAAYKSAQGQYGNDSGITRKAETSLLGQQAAVEKLKASIRGLATEEKMIGAGSTGMTRIRDGAQSARAGIDKLAGSYGVLSGKMMAMMAIATTGAGLFTITDSAMQAGEKIYKMSQRLHTSATEAAQLNKTLEMAGTDYQQVIPVITRLDKSIESAGYAGNDLTMSMQQFGISLTDSAGNLLPMNEQLKQLADGYHTASEAGNEEAYVADVLGARGAQLVPLLEQYNDLMEASSQVKTTGLINPEEAHQLYLEWTRLKIEAGQLSTAFGAAMMPIAKDIMPEVSDEFENMIKYIHDNKDDIKAGIETWGSALKGVADAATGALGAVTELASAIRNTDTAKALRNDEQTLEAARQNQQISRGHSLAQGAGGIIGGIGGFMLGGPWGAAAGAYVGQEISGDAFTEIGKATTPFRTWEGAKTRIDLQQQERESLKAFQEQQKKNTAADKDNADAAKKNAAAQYETIAKLEERRKATADLTEEIYNLTHSDYDNAVHAMQKKIADALNKHVDQSVIDDYRSSEMAKINKDIETSVFEPISDSFKTDLDKRYSEIDRQAQRYREKAGSALDEGRLQDWISNEKSKISADWERQVAEQIDSVWQSEYQNQLTRIENERQAWITKGLDEVKAAEWAEEQKKQIQQRTAVEAFTTQKKYLEIYRNAIAAGQGQQGAAMQIAQQMRKDKGIPDDAYTSPGELAGFEDAMKSAQDHLIPVLSDSVYAGVKRAMIEVQRGTNVNYELPEDMKQKLIPREYQNYMPVNAIPMPQYTPARGHENDTTRQGAGGDITVKVNIDRPYVNDDKAITQLADNVSKKIIDATQQGQYKY